MTKTALEVVQKFQRSMGRGTDEWQDLFAEDTIFKGPVIKVEGKEANIEFNKQFAPLVKNYEPINVFEQENFVALEGVYSIQAPSGKIIDIEMAETYEIINEKIQNIKVYYDAEEYRKEFEVSINLNY